MTKAMVFAVTQQDADTAPDVVTGITPVFDRDAHILIDPGATHYFISMGLFQMSMWSMIRGAVGYARINKIYKPRFLLPS